MTRNVYTAIALSAFLGALGAGCSTINVNYNDLKGRLPPEHRVTYGGFRQSRVDFQKMFQDDLGGMNLGWGVPFADLCCYFVEVPFLFPLALLNVPLCLVADTILLPYTLPRDWYLRKKAGPEKTNVQPPPGAQELPTMSEVLSSLQYGLLLDFRKEGESQSTTNAPFTSQSFELTLHQEGERLVGPIVSTDSVLAGSATITSWGIHDFSGAIDFQDNKGKWIQFDFTLPDKRLRQVVLQYQRSDGTYVGMGTARYLCNDGACVGYHIEVTRKKPDSLY